MWNTVEYLKDPHLVRLIQNNFGVRAKEEIEKARRRPTTPSKSSPNGIIQSEPASEEGPTSGSDVESKNYLVTHKFWYYLFVFGTELGDEIFYASFIPFWFWNIDGAVGRRVVMVWTIIMCIGQGIKDIICWPRPASPPVFRLQQKWALEYGMPSTHAMVGVSIPFSVLFYTSQRYEYPFIVGLLIAVLWCSVISVSRLYLGMHTVLDVIVGLILALILMIPVVPIVDNMDHFWLTNRWAPMILITGSVLIIAFYPKTNIWTPTRQDTTMIISVCIGVHIGAWTNYQLGTMSEPKASPPYEIIWPSYEMIGLTLLRCALGFSCILATRAICKSASYATLCFFLRLNANELKKTVHTTASSTKNTVELCYKFITYSSIGFNTLYLLPSVFSLLGIERPTFHTEI
ncbi:sphingosine-1-phosphate phosphatase 2-like [Cimex lectularius]|uniref:Phosphatidic acid phosphatase type 2/haloperoxidase domain-containing protein n=1 Tax=Cimex lectularius TaxID=79782 RepID=A0A8I6RTY2_CIMLE|nr:sphingosine-1-phosphate phosphatase 2-like [Cimex lectularius]